MAADWEIDAVAWMAARKVVWKDSQMGARSVAEMVD